jgi:hypothetical protein
MRVSDGHWRRMYFFRLISQWNVRYIHTALETSVRGTVLIRDVPNVCANGTSGIHG